MTWVFNALMPFNASKAQDRRFVVQSQVEDAASVSGRCLRGHDVVLQTRGQGRYKTSQWP